MPPDSLMCCARRLLPCLEPLALPSITTSPSTTPTTGLMERTLPARAAVLEMRPPFFRYSSVSRRAISLIFFFSFSSVAAMDAASMPESLSCRAYSTSARSPTVAFSLSTTKTLPSNSRAAIQALCHVPESLPDKVMIMA